MGVAWATTIAAGLLATGCSAGSTGGGAEPTPPPIAASPTAPATGYDGLTRLPLSAYGTSQQDDDRLFTANKALVVRCMKGRGHQSYSGQNMIGATVETEADKEAAAPSGAWGYIGRATAGRQGFHPPASETGGAAGLAGQEGKDFAACAGEAQKQLPDQTSGDGWKLTQALFGRSLQEAGQDARVTAARKRWSACMSAAGHPAEDPEKLAAGPWNTAKPTADEIAKAAADESCTRSSNLAAVYFAVLDGYQRQLESNNAEALNAYQKEVQERRGKVSRLLAGHPG
ncbi:hypothetical protein [Streptomyces sp. NPDC050263]|uniref:hypothetical protein n=1 Tax=Streptomyces sp. NPDC050263 TaxID=3155037 RepID=UPI00344AE253